MTASSAGVGPVTVYSCTFDSYDWSFGPLELTRSARFLKFGDARAGFADKWEHLPLPEATVQPTQTLTNRYIKFHPHLVAGEEGVAIYVDGNILIKSDLTPLTDEFIASGADIALFPHPSGRTVDEEFDFALRVGTIPSENRDLAEIQRRRYREAGLSDCPITENTIIFYKLTSPRLAAFGTTLWEELLAFSRRDQVSLPFAVETTGISLHLWDWHFTDPDNPYFARTAHKKLSWIDRQRTVIFFLKDYSPRHALLARMINLGGRLRRGIGL